MTRRRAEDRFSDITPPADWPPSGDRLAAAIAALVHPSRRVLLDYLSTRGPAPVGRLARATGLAPGSVSHHVRVLARAGLVEPAPELAGDTRESWWRHVPRSLSWGDAAFGEGAAAEQLGRAASDANLAYLLDAVRRWRSTAPQPGWDSLVTDALVPATAGQLDDLNTRLVALVRDWSDGCRASASDEDAEPRHPVRVIALAFPEEARRS